MAEYWKSTPSYWCKFCELYVRDTPIERKNHESTGRHQGNIQRSLRELHKKQEKATRDQQRAKDEVARLNGLVGGKDGRTSSPGPSAGARPGSKLVSGPAPPTLSAAAQRKAHAEQLIAMGVELPEELKREITGVGGWQTTSERVVDDGGRSARTLAEIKREEEEREASFAPADGMSKGVHKRRAEDEEEARDEEAAPKARKVWGSAIKVYPGSSAGQDGGEDLDALLGGVTTKKEKGKKTEEAEPKAEAAEDEEAKADIDATTKPEPVASSTVLDEGVKTETSDSAITAPPAVVFKKRKGAKR